MEDGSSLSLFAAFADGFEISAIYEVGWEAARSWMAVVSGVLLATAITIRSLQEKVNLLSGGKSGYMPMVVNVLIIVVAMGLYFTIAQLLIALFNSMYGALDGTAVTEMGTKLDSVMAELRAKDHEFSWSEVTDAPLAGVALIMYWITHMGLILVSTAMRICHALLVSFCIFWGAVALPMGIVTGLKPLSALKNLAQLVLFWPIVESFFLFAIGIVFTKMLTSQHLDVSQFSTWNMGVMTFYLSAFTIINCLLIGALIAAPFVAQGLANGSGNVTGMISSFAGAGVAAGMAVAKQFAPRAVANAAKGTIFRPLNKAESGGGSSRDKFNSMSNKGSAFGSSASGSVNTGKSSYQKGKSTGGNSSSPKPTSTSSAKSSTSSGSMAPSSKATGPAAKKDPKDKEQVDTDKLENEKLVNDKNSSNTPSESQPNSDSKLDNVTPEQRKKKSREGRAGYFINKAKQNPKS